MFSCSLTAVFFKSILCLEIMLNVLSVTYILTCGLLGNLPYKSFSASKTFILSHSCD